MLGCGTIHTGPGYQHQAVKSGASGEDTKHQSTEEQTDFHFDQQPRTVTESVVGGVVSAVKAVD